MTTIPLKYNVRNLLVRKVTTSMTVLGISLVVATFVALMAMAQGLDRALVATGVPGNAVALRKGAIADAASSLTVEQYRALRDLPQVATAASGEALASPELCFQVLREKADGGKANVILRGVRPVAFLVHDQVRASAPLAPRAGQLLVGKGILQRYKGFGVGARLRLFHREYTVAGVMEAGGGGAESEVWCDLDDLQSDARRSYFSAVFAKLRGPDLQAAFARTVAEDPRIGLEARSEPEYYEEQSRSAGTLRALGLLVAVVMAVGAVFAAMNTMYAAISARTKEIATLRALGFSRWAVVTSFVAESMILALPGGVLGCLIALPVHGMATGTMNMRSFSDVTFVTRITPEIALGAVVASLAIGFLGGLMPAHAGASLPIVRALREV
jgi:putative ABC transport system permease protein